MTGKGYRHLERMLQIKHRGSPMKIFHILKQMCLEIFKVICVNVGIVCNRGCSPVNRKVIESPTLELRWVELP